MISRTDIEDMTETPERQEADTAERLVRQRAAAICEAIELRDYDAAHELARTMPAALAQMESNDG